ncbi:MAG: hypothetical protein Tsb009_15260 [Planctomycetaceae bacterium]
MQHSILKLAALAGVVSLGFLVVLQTQFGLSRPIEELEASTSEINQPSTAATNSNHAPSLPGQSEPKPTTEHHANSPSGFAPAMFVQNEPAPPKSTGGYGSGQRQPSTGSLNSSIVHENSNSSPFASQTSEQTNSPSKSTRTVDYPPSSPDEENQPTPLFGATSQPSQPETNSDKKTPAVDQGSPFAPEEKTEESPMSNGPLFGRPEDRQSQTGSSPNENKTENEQPQSLFGPEPAETVENNQPESTAKQPGNPFGGSGGNPPVLVGPTEKSKEPPMGESPFASQPEEKSPANPPSQKTGSPFEFEKKYSKDNVNTEQKRIQSGGQPGGEKATQKPEAPKSLFGSSEEKSPMLPTLDSPPETNGGTPESPQQKQPFPTTKTEKKTENSPPSFPSLGAPAPNRLSPEPKAARLKTEPDTSLHGDGTVKKSDPRGPQRALLTIEKNAPKNAVLGKPFIYDIVIKNVGTSPAFQVVVEDRIPKGVKLTGTAPQAFLSGKKLIWKLGKLPPGKETKISVRVIPVAPGHVGSVATVNFVSEVAADTLISAPKLKFQLIGPTEAKLGESLAFKFVITNSGTAIAKDVWIRDLIPDGLKHPAGKDLEYKVGELKPGQTETVTLKLTAVKSGKVTNRGVVTSKGGVRLESNSVVKIAGTPLVISRAGPKRRVIGRTAIYTNLVTNASSDVMSGAKLTEVIPAGMKFVEATDGGQYDPVRRMVAWNVGTLKPKQSRAFRVKLVPEKSGELQSRVKAFLPNGTVAEVQSRTAIQGYPVMGIDVNSVDRPVEIGEKVTLQIVAKNRGTGDSHEVKIQLRIPDHLELVEVRGAKFTQRGTAISLAPVSKIQAGGKLTIDVVLKARRAGDVRVGVGIQSREMQKPLNSEEAILITPSTSGE